MKGSRLLFLVNDAGFFLSHRLPVAIAARSSGYEVHIATALTPAVEEIKSHGFIHHPVRLSRGGTNPFSELATMVDMHRLLRSIKPDLVHLVTPKPVLYGGIAARLAGISSVVAAISGLGHVFSSHGLSAQIRRQIVKVLYRLALKRRNIKVIFQNPTDRELLVQSGAIHPESVVMIRGSGVDLTQFSPIPEPDQVPVVMFAARLLKAKGVYEFVAAAAALKQAGVKARFLVVGDPDPDNPTSVTERDLTMWRREGVIEILGYRRDIPRLIASSNLVVFPSYYGEGLPKVLVEAAACGRAVVTTDIPGCRDAIDPGISGLLVPPKDIGALVGAMKELLSDTPRRHKMAAAGRVLAEREYGIERIVAAHLAVYRGLLSGAIR